MIKNKNFNDLSSREKWDTWKDQKGTWHCRECGGKLSDGPRTAGPFRGTTIHCGYCDAELTRRHNGGQLEPFGWVLMKPITIEMYYGYYLGDHQEWSTDYVTIPGDTPEEKYEEVAKGIFLETMNKVTDNHGEPLHIAFCGLLCVDNDSMEDEVPEGVDAVCENCGEPCKYDSEICLCDKCRENVPDLRNEM